MRALKDTLYLCGAGNSEGVRLAMTIDRDRRRWRRLALLDDDPAKLGTSLLGVEVIGGLSLLGEVDPDSSEAVSLVARTTAGRAAVRKRMASYPVPFALLVHPQVDTFGAELSEGVLVYESAVIGPETSIGENSVIFMRAIIGHESHVGRGCVIAAGAVLNARVQLEDEVYVGTNASILPEVKVGRGATIGSNSSVIEDVPAGATVVGVPGEVLEPAKVDAQIEDDTPRRPNGFGERLKIEELVVEIFQEVLGTDVIDPRQNFFDAGGTSLLALQAVSRLRSATGLRVSTLDVFRFASARKVAVHLEGDLLTRSRSEVQRKRERVRRARAELRERRIRFRSDRGL